MMRPRYIVRAFLALAIFVPSAILAQEMPPAAKPAHDFAAELPRVPAVEPDAAGATFTLQPGYRLELVAAEPLVQSPVAVAWDERGKMFVAEMRGYSEHRDERLSRIRVLSDADDDGIYDEAKVFAEKLRYPTALACWNGGLFVADAPDILYLKDTDGDGAADLMRRVYTGLGFNNVQGLVNTFLWHFDNRIHGAASSNGGELMRVGDRDAKAIAVRGRDFSFDPRSFDVRAESGGAQHGMSFDDWGRKFVCSNSDHAQQVLFEDRYAARNPLIAAPSARISIAVDGPQAEVYRSSPVEPWRIVRTRLRVQGAAPGPIEGGGRAAGYFTGATGATIIRGDAFAAEDRGLLVVGDVGGNLIHRKKLSLNGVRYSAARIDPSSEWVASSDNWFRPAQFANGPDGGLYVVDVYREVIEHPLSLPPEIKKHLDLDSGRDRGRIYRLTPHGYTRPKSLKWDNLTAAEWVARLGHDNAWHRETAARLIYERRPRGIVEPLVQLATGMNSAPLARVHAYYALAGQDALTPAMLLSAFASDHPRVREHAIRLSERFLSDSTELQAKVKASAEDADAAVRYQAAFSLAGLPIAEKVPPLAAILKRDGGDAAVRFACLSSLREGAGDVLLALLADPAYRSLPAARDTLQELAQLVGREQRPESPAAMLQALESVDANHSAATLAVLSGLQAGAARGGTTPFAKLPPEFMPRATALIEAATRAAREIAADRTRPTDDRTAAIRSLAFAKFADLGDSPAEWLSVREPREVRAAALALLSLQTEPRVGQILLQAWPAFSPESRRAAAEALIARPDRAVQLLQAIEGGVIQAGELEPAAIDLLKKHAHQEVRERAQKWFTAVPRPRQEIVDTYRSALTLSGDVIRGKAAFAKNCAACHRVENVGFEVGPSLAAMKNRGAEAILLNIFDPNREVNPQFLSYVLLTTDGRSLSGMIAAESSTGITLKRGEGVTEVISRENIEALRSTGVSLMPEGLEKQLDVPTTADLLVYLLSLK